MRAAKSAAGRRARAAGSTAQPSPRADVADGNREAPEARRWRRASDMVAAPATGASRAHAVIPARDFHCKTRIRAGRFTRRR
jgi:hypothetical protein